MKNKSHSEKQLKKRTKYEETNFIKLLESQTQNFIFSNFNEIFFLCQMFRFQNTCPSKKYDAKVDIFFRKLI